MLANEPWRVLLVDDHPLVRDGLRAAIRRVLPQTFVIEAGSGAAAEEKQDAHLPHLILIDVNLPDTNGLDLAQKLRLASAQVKLLMVAGEVDPWTVQWALDAGVNGFMAKVNSGTCLAQAVLAVLDGKTFLCDDSRAALARANRHGAPPKTQPGPAVLSCRERELLRYLAHGESTKAIASLLEISPKTVETHRQHIMQKLGTNNIAALACYAIRHGMMTV